MKSPRQNKLVAAKVRCAVVLAVAAILSLGCFETPANVKKALEVRCAPKRVEFSLVGVSGQTKTVSAASQRIRNDKGSRTVREIFYLNAGQFFSNSRFVIVGSEHTSLPTPLPVHMFVMPGTPPPRCLS